jgi:hypothetical protein
MIARKNKARFWFENDFVQTKASVPVDSNSLPCPAAISVDEADGNVFHCKGRLARPNQG